MLKINKKDKLIQGLKVVTIFGIGYYIGVYRGGYLFNEGLKTLGKTGITMSKIIDGKQYILSVTEK